MCRVIIFSSLAFVPVVLNREATQTGVGLPSWPDIVIDHALEEVGHGLVLLAVSISSGN